MHIYLYVQIDKFWLYFCFQNLMAPFTYTLSLFVHCAYKNRFKATNFFCSFFLLKQKKISFSFLLSFTNKTYKIFNTLSLDSIFIFLFLAYYRNHRGIYGIVGIAYVHEHNLQQHCTHNKVNCIQ